MESGDAGLEAIRRKKLAEMKARAAGEPAQAKAIVYGTPTCPFCSMAREYLQRKGVAFTYYDVSADQGKAQEMMAKSGQGGVPVIDINGRIIVGFDRERVERALAAKDIDPTLRKQNLAFDILEEL